MRSWRAVNGLNVNKILRSRNLGENNEEESNAKKTKPSPRTVTASPSGSSWSEAFDGNGNVSDDNGKFDLTNDNLRDSYANPSKRIKV